MGSIGCMIFLLSFVGHALGQETVDKDLTETTRLMNKLELLTNTVVELNMQLKQVSYYFTH